MARCTHLPFMQRVVVLRARWARLMRGLQLRTIWSEMARGSLFAAAFRRRFVVMRLRAGQARDRQALRQAGWAGWAQRVFPCGCISANPALVHCGAGLSFMVVASCNRASMLV